MSEAPASTGTAASAALHVATAQELRQELSLGEPAAAKPVDRALEAKADKFVAALLSLDPADFKSREDGKGAIENMGLDLQRRAAQKSEMLKQPIKKLTERSQEGGDVANALIDLKMKVEEIDPGQLDLEPGWFARTLGRIPGVGTPLKRYFTKYESAQTVIEAIIRSLQQGRDQLTRDNVTLAEDQKIMRELTFKLEQAVRLGQLIDAKLEQKLRAEIAAGSEQHKFVSEELLFPLRQRIIDLQQQLVVNQQGVLASEIVIRNNKELVRGVNRALNVTVSALQVGATVAIALANQKNVIDTVEAVNKSTSDVIAGTAKRLRTQGAQIHKQAASAQLDMASLKTAFADVKAAMEDIASFRLNALPQMAQTVLELDRLSADADEAIRKMEQGNRARPGLAIDVE
jgi:uncharacterized protein YaaN involved in tellurite resistance